MEYCYHVTKAGIPSGTILSPTYQNNKGKVSAFFRALCQSPEIFCATLTSAQYVDALVQGPINSNAGKWATEGLFEFVRMFYFPNTPPRYNCIFAFREIELAEQFIREIRLNEDSAIYSCLLNNCIPFEADMSLFTAVNTEITQAQVNIKNPLQKQIKEISKKVHTYWEATKAKEIPEILLSGGNITITERVR